MTDTLALENLYTQVVAQFAAEGTLLANAFGWREYRKHVTNAAPGGVLGNRLIWLPGNEAGDGDAGKLLPPRYPGNNPRSLGTLGELFTVYVLGCDPTAPENELAQYKVTRFNFDAWYRAVYLAAYGTFTIESVKWDRTKTERQHGAMLVAVCTIQAMIPDVTYPSAPVDTHALLTTHVLSQTDPTVEVDHT